MTQTARKLNFMIGNEVADELEKLVPSGQRSKLVSHAIAKELALFRRKTQTENLLKLREKTPKLSTAELVAAVKADRQR